MKKIMKKMLIILIIFVMLFEFSFSSSISYAAGEPLDAESWVDRITSLMGGLISVKLWLFRLQATAAIAVLWESFTLSLAESCGVSTDTFFDWSSGKLMTPFDIFFNKYNILDVNFFEIEEVSWWKKIGTDNIMKNLRLSVAAWYYALRNIAAVILLCILIYVGIRMALSTIAEEKAKYQRMLYDWICSFILIFVLQYIIIFTIEANNAIVKFIRNSLLVAKGVLGASYTSMDAILGKMAIQATTAIGMGSFISIIALCMIFFQTVSFFFAYMNRVLKVAFLIIISPLISVTYSIDKMGDGKAQALNSWLKEFVYTILIQPFHAILYMAFVNTAMALLDMTNPWIGAISNIIGGSYNEIVNAVLVILCLKFVGDGEKIIRKIFNFQDDSSKTSLAAGAAVGLAGLNMMKKGTQIGTKVAGLGNKIGALPVKFEKFSKALDAFDKTGKIKEKFDKTGIGKALQSEQFKNKTKKLRDNLNAAADKAKAMKSVAWVSKKIKGFKKEPKYKKLKTKKGTALSKLAKLSQNERFRKLMEANRKYFPYTLALMGAAMSYSTGSSGAMQAIGMGNAFKQGGEGYFSAAGSSQSDEARKMLRDDVLAHTKEYIDVENALGDNAIRSEQLDREIEDLNAQIYARDPEGIYQSVFDAGRAEKKDNEELYELLEKRQKKEQEQNTLKENTRGLKKKKKAIEKKVDEKLQTMDHATIRQLLQNMDNKKSKISKAKSEILKQIQQAMKEQKIRAADKNPATIPIDELPNYDLTEDELADAKILQQQILMMLDRSVIGSGADFNTRKQVHDLFGSENTRIPGLEKAIENYKSSKRASEYCTARDNCAKFGAEEESFRHDVIRKLTGQYYQISEVFDAEDGSDFAEDLDSVYKSWGEHYSKKDDEGE